MTLHLQLHPCLPVCLFLQAPCSPTSPASYHSIIPCHPTCPSLHVHSVLSHHPLLLCLCLLHPNPPPNYRLPPPLHDPYSPIHCPCLSPHPHPAPLSSPCPTILLYLCPTLLLCPLLHTLPSPCPSTLSILPSSTSLPTSTTSICLHLLPTPPPHPPFTPV